jgi:hypothetical protein
MDPEVPLRGRVTPTYHRFVGEPTELLRQWYASYQDCSGDWARWTPAEDSALLTEGATGGDRVGVDSVRRLDFQALFAFLVVVVHRLRFYRLGVVIRRQSVSYNRNLWMRHLNEGATYLPV